MYQKRRICIKNDGFVRIRNDFAGYMDHSALSVETVEGEAFLYCIYMPAIDRPLSLLCIYMPAIDRPLSDCRQALGSTLPSPDSTGRCAYQMMTFALKTRKNKLKTRNCVLKMMHSADQRQLPGGELQS